MGYVVVAGGYASFAYYHMRLTTDNLINRSGVSANLDLLIGLPQPQFCYCSSYD